MPTCPYCNVEIDEDIDMTDFETYDDKVYTYNEKVYLYYIGSCHKCHRAFKWREVYILTNCNDEFEEIAP